MTHNNEAREAIIRLIDAGDCDNDLIPIMNACIRRDGVLHPPTNLTSLQDIRLRVEQLNMEVDQLLVETSSGSRGDINRRNKRGVEIHAKLEWLGKAFDAFSLINNDPDIPVVKRELAALVHRVLKDIFGA